MEQLAVFILQTNYPSRRTMPTLGGGGRGVSESMDGQGCAILALELVLKNLIFA